MRSIFQHKLIILIGGIIISFFFGCQKASINGNLDGRWQLMEIEENQRVLSVKDKQLYYNFYMHVFNLSKYGEYSSNGNFSFEDNKIFIDFPYINTSTGMERLNEYYIFSNPVEFEVEYLSKEKLILKEDDLLITLRKF